MGSLYYLDIRRWKTNPPNNQAKYDSLLNTSNLAGDAPDYPWYYDSYFNTPIATPTATADPTGHVFFTNTAHYLLKTSDGGDSWSAVWTSPGAAFIRAVSFGVGLAPDSLDHIGLAGGGGSVVVTHDGGPTGPTVNVRRAGCPRGPVSTRRSAIATNHDVMYVGNEARGRSEYRAQRGWRQHLGGRDRRPAAVAGQQGRRRSERQQRQHRVRGELDRRLSHDQRWRQLVRVGTGLPLAMVSDLYFEPTGKFLRIASYGRGVWELPLN